MLIRLIHVLLLLTVFLKGAVSAQAVHSYNPYIDVQHYAFAMEVSDLNNEVNASAGITVIFLKSTQTVRFDLISKNREGKGMKVISVKEKDETVSFKHEKDQIIINLKNPAKRGDTAVFHIRYGGVPLDGLVFSKNKYSQRTIFADNWPNRARNWLPCVDHPSDKASVDFMVTSPAHYKVVSNGLLIEESVLEGNKKFTHWKEKVALPTKVMVIGLADFAINYLGNVDCIPVSSWVFPPDKINGFYDYAQAMEILPFFIKQVGPYAYEKLANVEAITIFGGMENAGAIFYNERSITGKRSHSEELMAHEIAHQWFGNSATESGWPHVWLSEGFATEMTHLYLENKYGPDTLSARLIADRKAVIEFAKTRYTPIVDSSEQENFLALLNRNSYEKGGWVLHMLRRKLGDSLFWTGVRTYYKKYAGSNAATNDFNKIMEEVSGIDLKDFFQQWLYRAGHPVLQMTWKYDEKRKMVLLKIIQEQKQLFSFPLELAFQNTGKSIMPIHSLNIKDKITTIEIPMPAKPMQVIADPSTNLLFQGSIKEI